MSPNFGVVADVGQELGRAEVVTTDDAERYWQIYPAENVVPMAEKAFTGPVATAPKGSRIFPFASADQLSG
jgi:hypothetical protein